MGGVVLPPGEKSLIAHAAVTVTVTVSRALVSAICTAVAVCINLLVCSVEKLRSKHTQFFLFHSYLLFISLYI